MLRTISSGYLDDERMLKNETILIAKEVLEKDEDVLLAYLFGSAARNEAQPISDVDIAVLLRENSLEKQAEILWKVANALHVPEDRIDIVDLSRADVYLKYNILKEGVKLVDRGIGEEIEREISELYPEARERLEIVLREWLKEDPRIDKAIISRRLDEILKIVAIIRERYIHKTIEWLLQDPERMLALERAMERIIGAMTDICRHVVSAKRLGLIETYSEYPMRLAQHRLMPRELADKVAELIRLRNILAHRYLEVDYAKLLAKAQETSVETAPSFVEWTKKLISSEVDS